MELIDSKIIRHITYKGAYKILMLEAPSIAKQVQPGQFIHLQIPNAQHLLLRRPFSIYQVQGNSLSVLYKVVGEGTSRLAMAVEGSLLSVIGPLGNGFPPGRPENFPVLIAGGYGIAALYLCAERFSRKGIAFFGGATQGDILCVNEFTQLGWDVYVATEDGSMGEKGLVTDIVDKWLKDSKLSENIEIFSCGPDGMLQSLAVRFRTTPYKAWLSLDRHMACGVGACLTCVDKIKNKDGIWEWKRVCRDGPVFECRNIITKNN